MTKYNQQKPNFGIGLYTLSEASRLSQIPYQNLNRLVFGYKSKSRTIDPLWNNGIDFDAQKTLSFRDLIEAHAVKQFINAGLSIKQLRKASKLLQEELGEYPFSSKKLVTDGKALLKRNVEVNRYLLDVLDLQVSFSDVIEKSLVNIEYKNNIPEKWWILGKDKPIILDPNRSFGQPIHIETGIATSTLFNAVESHKGAEDKFSAAGEDFGIDSSIVKHAYKFEQDLHAESIY